VIALTLEPPPAGTTHWSVRRLAHRVGMSETTVWRIWRSAGLKPHRTETFTWSTDPDLVPKVRDVVGLYLAPPERAIVLSLDEKTQIQALDRTSRCCRSGPGRSSGTPTTTSATARPACSPPSTWPPARSPRRHAPVIPGPTSWPSCAGSTAHTPTGSCTSSSTTSPHKTPAVRAWLERHPRISFHFTPTPASWLNQIETWFGILSRQAIRRGSFGSVRELIAMIDTFTANWNAGATPFTWIKTADEILAKAVRKRPATNEPRH